MSETPEDYSELHRALADAGVAVAAAELHGGLCGTLCAGSDPAARAWVEQCLDGSRAGPEQLAELRDRLRALERDTRGSLEQGELGFMPYLPDDDASIDTRADALALWCHGFLVGLGLGGLDLDSGGEASSEVRELVADLAEISKATANPDAEAHEDGFALAELTEYVRVGVQYLYDNLGRGRSVH